MHSLIPSPELRPPHNCPHNPPHGVLPCPSGPHSPRKKHNPFPTPNRLQPSKVTQCPPNPYLRAGPGPQHLPPPHTALSPPRFPTHTPVRGTSLLPPASSASGPPQSQAQRHPPPPFSSCRGLGNSRVLLGRGLGMMGWGAGPKVCVWGKGGEREGRDAGCCLVIGDCRDPNILDGGAARGCLRGRDAS